MQSKRQTMIEVGVNVTIGLIGSWLLTWSVIKMNYSPAMTATLACILCTIWSVVRNYYIRRYFNTVNSVSLNTTQGTKSNDN